MWGLKTTTVPVVMGALGTIKKDMENYSNKIPNPPSQVGPRQQEIQSTVSEERWQGKLIKNR